MSQAHQKRDLGSLGFTFFSFLFFSFLFFSFDSSRRFLGADCFCSFLLICFFFFSLDLNVIVELKLNAEINFISIHYLERMEFPTNFWNSVLPVSNCSYSIDQQNTV